MQHYTTCATMSKKNENSRFGEQTMRITRAQAKALAQSGVLPPPHPSLKRDKKQVLRPTFKRAASDENKPDVSTAPPHQHKKRAVLGDVTNIICKNSSSKCISGSKIQNKKGSTKRNARVLPAVLGEKPEAKEKRKESTNDAAIVRSRNDICLPENPEEHKLTQPNKWIGIRECSEANRIHHSKYGGLQSQSHLEGSKLSQREEGSDDHHYADIDAKTKDPLMCGLYAPDIYRIMSAMEISETVNPLPCQEVPLFSQLGRQPSVDYMEKLQKDITQAMRSILIDWLVEVSEEYRLVPDTLYLTVNLIDRFLAGNYIEKQKLQLLGVTCMLIASKYEEICAPRAEEFCFITDNTYAKDEVVKMENRVLNFLEFQLSVPTTKKFLRRFIQAAQASYMVPSVELEFLANYLAELTLLEYSFVKFLPSITAASAVFLARWTLDQSDHPWTPTLEHYTSYKAHELKTTVLALQDLQLDTSGCRLNAIREKYRHGKFKSVATLSPPKPVQELFSEEPLGV